MIPSNIEKLINALVEKTKEKSAIWGKTSRPNEFKLFLDKAAVTTDFWLQNDNTETVDFAIYNSYGDKIDSYFATRGEEDFELLNLLYNVSKREFYKVDETIEGLLGEVLSNKSIGKREIEKDPNELPF